MAGTYTVTVTVTDTAGQSSTATAQVTVNPLDSPPAARLSVSPTSGNAPLNVTADASASTDTDSTPIASYRFDFGDGVVVGPQSGSSAAHTYSAAGSYTVTVRVTDTAGQSTTATVTVNVSPAAGANLVGNPGFETDTTGWNNNGRTGITLTRVSGGHSGSWAAAMTNTTTTTQTDCTLNDPPQLGQGDPIGDLPGGTLGPGRHRRCAPEAAPARVQRQHIRLVGDRPDHPEHLVAADHGQLRPTGPRLDARLHRLHLQRRTGELLLRRRRFRQGLLTMAIQLNDAPIRPLVG